MRYFKFIYILSLLFCLIGCGCKHDWQEATCTISKTCSVCLHTEGNPAGHNWIDATCEHPKQCEICGKTDGNSLTHLYVFDSNIFGSGYNVCIYCEEFEPNVFCPNCDWTTFTTGVGIDGITCPKCGTKVI